MPEIIHVVSVSGGKDSAATLLLACASVPRDRLRAISCDTNNEHAEVYAYLDYLEAFTGVKIERLRADFSDRIAAKRRFIALDRRIGREYDTEPVVDADGNPVWKRRPGRGEVVTRWVRKGGVKVLEPVQKTRKIGGGRRIRWSNKAKRRALSALHPTGNAFLDLCMWKGRFPSRKGQFCTEELKRNIAVEYQLGLIDAGHLVVSWQGVRRDESQNRRNAKKIERLAPGMWAVRPLVDWTADDVFAYTGACGLTPNPLYLKGMGRVGCMPCINAGKDELRQIVARFPDCMVEKAEWETRVGLCSKHGFSTFFNKELHAGSKSHRRVYAANRIGEVIRWAHTTRGGGAVRPSGWRRRCHGVLQCLRLVRRGVRAA